MRKLISSAALIAAAASTLGSCVGSASATPVTGTIAKEQVIIRSSNNSTGELDQLVAQVGGHVDRRLSLIDAVTATVPSTAVAMLEQQPGVAEVSPDAAVQLAGASGNGIVGSTYNAGNDAYSLFHLETQVGARKLWTGGWTGSGVDVALIDSGIAPVAGLSPSNMLIGPDLTEESQNPATDGLDGYGHGTFLAGIIAGHDAAVTNVSAAASDTADFLGMAPDARIVSVKVADAHGNTDVSQVIAGIDWVVQHAHDPGLNIRVMNLSFGTDSSQPYTIDPLAYAAEQAWKHGIVVVTSAGNSGASSGRMTDPATDPYVIAVGADDSMGTSSINDDVIPGFSSNGDGTRNPDLVAPGTHVQSLRDPGSFIDTAYGSTGQIDSRFFRGSGTSQAAAMVTGGVALLLSMNPSLSPDQVKYLLTSTAVKLPAAGAQAQGAGLMNLKAGAPLLLPIATQTFQPSIGTGTLEGSRGDLHVVITNSTTGVTTELTGERDIFGHAFPTGALASLESAAQAWGIDGSFNGTVWTGSGWTSSSWASSSWASSSWASSSWASSSWASSSWATDNWANSSWKSGSWSSSAWASKVWR